MRHALLSLLLLIGSVGLAHELNRPLATFGAEDEAGKERKLAAHRGQVVVVIAWSSRGPNSLGYAERLRALAKRHAAKPGEKPKVVFYALASNHFETRETLAAAKKRDKLPFPILLDRGGAIAKQIKTFSTPTALVVDGEGVLRYRGAIDDDPRNPKAVEHRYLQDAVEAVLAGRKPSKQKTKVAGFRIRFQP